jgi:Fe-S cluster assembly protein SufD
LLLGSGTVHSIPKLLIKTDAVKASHGASVATVSGEQLHYLQSRGITRADAEQMIVRGFTQGVVERLPTESLRGRAGALLDKKQGGVHG